MIDLLAETLGTVIGTILIALLGAAWVYLRPGGNEA